MAGAIRWADLKLVIDYEIGIRRPRRTRARIAAAVCGCRCLARRAAGHAAAGLEMSAAPTRPFWRLHSPRTRPAAAAAGAFDADRYLDHIKFLASPEMKGRATGSPELEKAAAVHRRAVPRRRPPAAARRAAAICSPSRSPPARKLGNALTASSFSTGGEIADACRSSKEFIPFNFSASGKASGGSGLRGLRHHRARIQLRRLRRPRRRKASSSSSWRTSRRNTIPKAFSRARSTPTTRSFTARPPTPKRTARAA